MAKRRTARHVETDDADDDGYAWDEPPKKKKKKSSSKKKRSKTSGVSASGKKKSTTSSARKSARSGSGKKSSTRSKASGSARSKGSGRRSGRSAEAGASGRRRRSAPPKKKDDNTVMIVSAISITLILIVGIVFINKARTPAPQVNHQTELDTAREMLNKGKAKFREYNQAKQAGQPSQALFQEALTSLQTGMEQMSAVLQQPQYVDAEGFTKPEYEGYETEMMEAAQLIVDLEKGGSLH